jgi:hypothetical protein
VTMVKLELKPGQKFLAGKRMRLEKLFLVMRSTLIFQPS